MKPGDMFALNRDEMFLLALAHHSSELRAANIVTISKDEFLFFVDASMYLVNMQHSTQKRIRFDFLHASHGLIWNSFPYINTLSGYSYYEMLLTQLKEDK
jgi:hypothetical protein